MDWSVGPSSQPSTSRPTDFDDIADCSFHGNDSLLNAMEVDEIFAPFSLDFSDVVDVSFHEGDSLIRDIRVDPMEDGVQVGGGRNDFDVRLIKEKALKTMGVKEVTYQLTFKDHLFRQEKK
jgi:hypothetical protein